MGKKIFENNAATLQEVEAVLDRLLMGNIPEQPISVVSEDQALQNVVDKVNRLMVNMQEVHDLTASLAQGQLNDVTVSRKNMLAGYLKQLQSELISFTWGLEELAKGKIVGKKEADGNELHQCFNKLVDQVADASTNSPFAMMDGDEQKMNSWRYHQILVAVNKLDIQMLEVNEEGMVVYANQPAQKMLNGRDRLVADGKNPGTDALVEYLARQSKIGIEYPVVEELHDKERNFWYRITSDVFKLPGGQRVFLHAIDDITDWRKKEKELRHSATTDVLTGTKTRGAGLAALQQVKDEPGDHVNCIVFSDIDKLKAVNDTFGHAEGDEYIKTIADLLLKSCRDTDIVARYGGDEFFILFADCSRVTAEGVMRRVTDKLDEMNDAKVKPYTMSLSYGIKEFGYEPDMSVDTLLDQVDVCMYEDKMTKDCNWKVEGRR